MPAHPTHWLISTQRRTHQLEGFELGQALALAVRARAREPRRAPLQLQLRLVAADDHGQLEQAGRLCRHDVEVLRDDDRRRARQVQVARTRLEVQSDVGRGRLRGRPEH